MIYVLLASLALAVAYAAGGPLGAIGVLYGLAAGTFGAVVLAWACFMVGRLMANKATPPVGTAILILAAFTKFPVMVGAWYLAKSFGHATLIAFSGAIVLVYSALVGWAATRRTTDS